MINDRYFYGSRIYRYQIMIGAKTVHRCASIAEDQDSVMRQLEAICGTYRTYCKIYCNGELKAEIGKIYNRNGDRKISERRIRCRETDEIYNGMADFMEQTGWNRKYCNYLINRTTRYEYID